MSVATSTSICPLLKRYIISSRCACSRSECISPLFIFILCRAALICFTVCFLPENTITLFRSPALKMCFIISSFCVSWQMYALCLIFSAGLLTASFTLTGFFSSFEASFSMLSGIVAEKRMVWQFFGSLLAMVIMSS